MASDRARDLVVTVATELEGVMMVIGSEEDAYAAFDRIADIFDVEFGYALDQD